MKDYTGWVREAALPMWAERGFDPAAGRFVERLDPAGRPLAVPHRAMVQARQVYVFAHAAELGWFPAGAALAEAAMASLRRDFLGGAEGRAGCAFSVDPASGQIVSATRDSYTHAFLLFALAHLHRLNGDPALARLAEEVGAFVDRELVDPGHGGVVDALPAAGPHKRQNPQMHLLEAYLALEEAMPGRGWLARADGLAALFADRMAHPDHGVLPEYFTADWAEHPDPGRANVWEPGHHYEWAWLLDRHERLGGREARDRTGGHWRRALHDAAMQAGHAESGLIFDEVGADRTPTKPSHRLWPHTEAIKAAAVRHREGDPAALPFARAMGSLLAKHFLDTPFRGGWTDQITPTGAPAVGYVPASSLYHLFLAAAEAAGMKERAGDARGAQAPARQDAATMAVAFPSPSSRA